MADLEANNASAESACGPNALTVDVEDYFQVLNLRSFCPLDRWDEHEFRCPDSTRLILDLLDEYDTKASFFCLGWVAERAPDLIREIHARGHEVASHGYDHQLVPDLGEEGFRADVRKTSEILESLTGEPVRSFRACTWSITQRTPWAHRVLAEAGIEIDSSVHPIKHPDYGVPDALMGPHLLEAFPGKMLFELPPLVVPFFGKRLPLGGGGYLRLFPISWISAGLRGREKRDEVSCLYLHQINRKL